jgi:hypothetical protein
VLRAAGCPARPRSACQPPEDMISVQFTCELLCAIPVTRSASREAPPTFPAAQRHPADGRNCRVTRNIEAGLHPARRDQALEVPSAEVLRRASTRRDTSTSCWSWRDMRQKRRSRQERQCINIPPGAWLVGSGRVDQRRDELLITRADPPFWTVRAAAMSCIEDIRSWVFCASACRCGGARMGRWQAVGEIQIGALVPEGYEDSGSLINALTRVARWARERRKMLRPRPCCVTFPVPAAWSGQPLSAGARARREWVFRGGVPRRGDAGLVR